MDKLTLRLIIYSIFLVMCLVTLILRLTQSNQIYMLYEFEYYAFFGALIYYLLMFIMDLLRKITNKTCDKAVEFFNQKYFRFVWTLCLTAALGFWGGLTFGWTRKSIPEGLPVYLMLFLHGILQLMLIVDLFLFNHTLQTSYLIDIAVLSILYVAYSIFIIIKKYCFTVNGLYPFVSQSFDYLLVVGIVYYMLMLNMYFLHQFLLMKKLKISFGTTTVSEKSKTTKNGKTETFI